MEIASKLSEARANSYAATSGQGDPEDSFHKLYIQVHESQIGLHYLLKSKGIHVADALLLLREMARSFAHLVIATKRPDLSSVLSSAFGGDGEVDQLRRQAARFLFKAKLDSAAVVESLGKNRSLLHNSDIEIATLELQVRLINSVIDDPPGEGKVIADAPTIIKDAEELLTRLRARMLELPDDPGELHPQIISTLVSVLLTAYPSLTGPNIDRLLDELRGALRAVVDDHRLKIQIALEFIATAGITIESSQILEDVFSNLEPEFGPKSTDMLGASSHFLTARLHSEVVNGNTSAPVRATARGVTSWFRPEGEIRTRNLWHLIPGGEKIMAVRHSDGELVELRIRRNDLQLLVEALADDSDARMEEMRVKFHRAFWPSLNQAFGDTDIQMNPLGYTRMIPWLSLGDMADRVSIWNPFRGRGVAPDAAERRCLLVIDRSFTQSEGIINRVALDEHWRTIAFDSNESELVELPEGLLRGSELIVFYCHGAQDVFDLALSGLKIRTSHSADFLRLAEISHLPLMRGATVLAIACQSGSTNLRAPGASIADACAVAGAADIFATLWSISAEIGAEFLHKVLDGLEEGLDVVAAGRRTIASDKRRFSSFMLMSAR